MGASAPPTRNDIDAFALVRGIGDMRPYPSVDRFKVILYK